MTQDTGMDVSPSWSALAEGLDDLQRSVRRYREKHDVYGDGSMAAGQAWDRMRRDETRARVLLKEAGVLSQEVSNVSA